MNGSSTDSQFRQHGDMTILHRDESIVVIDKPGGLLAVPGRGPGKADCVAARLRAALPAMIPQPAVHRLDLYTSGLMVFAVTAEAHRDLSRQFEERLVEKRYLAVVAGVIDRDGGTIELRFRLDPDHRPRQVYDPVHGRLGITRWRKLAVEGRTTRIEFIPLTGRTHQLRLHAAHPLGLGAPILGDSLYGSGGEGDRLLLHAAMLRFRHPATGSLVEFVSAPPF
jgi:tRNA pseudouridine32 synthase/23S rRNA pseudouridine746 synthase